jgi:hypothetical protein
MPCPPLPYKQCEEIHDHLNQSVNYTNNGIDFKAQLSPANIFQDLIFTGEQGFPCGENKKIQILFKHIVALGSGAMAASGASYIQDFAAAFINYFFGVKIHPLTTQILTKEFANYLRHYFSRDLNDLDTRTIPYPEFEDTIKNNLLYILDSYVESILKRKKPFTTEEKNNVLKELKKRFPDKYPHLTIEDPAFEVYAITSLAFHDLFIADNGKDLFAIASVPLPNHPLAPKLDILTPIKLRPDLTPGIQWPIEQLIKNKKPEKKIFPLGDHVVQALVNVITGQVQPCMQVVDGKPIASAPDLRMLLVRSIRGEGCSVQGGEKHVLKAVEAGSEDVTRKLVQNVLLNHAVRNPKDMFPLYLVEILKEIREDHFHGDPLASIALTFNLIRMLENYGYVDIIDTVILSIKPFCETTKTNNLLYLLFQLLSDTRFEFSHRLCLLKLLGNQFTHVKNNSIDYSHVNVLPRNVENKPFCELLIPVGKSTYSILLDCDKPLLYLSEVSKFLRISKTVAQNELIRNILYCLWPSSTFGGPLSSPLISEPEFFDNDLVRFETTAIALLDKRNGFNDQLLGLIIFLSTQTQIENRIPIINCFPIIETILMNGQKINKLLIQNLLVLLDKEEQTIYDFLKKIVDNKIKKEDVFIDQWVMCLSKIPAYSSQAYKIWKNKLLENALLTGDSLEKFYPPFVTTVLPYDTTIALDILYDVAKYTSLTMNMLNHLDTVVEKMDNDSDTLVLENILFLFIEDLTLFGSHAQNSISKILNKFPKISQSSELQEIMLFLEQQKSDSEKGIKTGPRKKPTESLTNILSYLKRGIERCPLEATMLWCKLFQRYPKLKQEITIEITQSIIEKIRDNPYALIKFILEPEIQKVAYDCCLIFEGFLLEALEELNIDQLQTNNKLYYQVLETLIRYVSKESNNCRNEFIDRVYAQLERIHSVGDEIPDSFIKSFNTQMPKLIDLFTKSKPFSLYGLYELASLFDLKTMFIKQNATKMCVTIVASIQQRTFKSEEKYITKLVKEISCFSDVTALIEFDDALNSLIKSSTSPQFIEVYFYKLTRVIDPAILLICFKQFVLNNDFRNAMGCLSMVKPKIGSDEVIFLEAYQLFILKLYQEKKWSLCCEAILVSPFNFHIEIEISWVVEIVHNALNYAVESRQVLNIMRVLTEYEVYFEYLWFGCIEKSKKLYDSDSIAWLWELIYDQIRLEKFSELTQQQLFLLAGSLLKKSSHKIIVDSMSTHWKLYKYYKNKMQQSLKSEFYGSILDGWLEFAKTKKGVYCENTLKQILDELHLVWKSPLAEHVSFLLLLKIIEVMMKVNPKEYLKKSIELIQKGYKESFDTQLKKTIICDIKCIKTYH